MITPCIHDPKGQNNFRPCGPTCYGTQDVHSTDTLAEGIDSIDTPATATQIGGTHYRDMAIQPIEYILANGIGFAEGNVIKYVSRWKAKNGVEDLKKARHFLDMLIEFEEQP